MKAKINQVFKTGFNVILGRFLLFAVTFNNKLPKLLAVAVECRYFGILNFCNVRWDVLRVSEICSWFIGTSQFSMRAMLALFSVLEFLVFFAYFQPKFTVVLYKFRF